MSSVETSDLRNLSDCLPPLESTIPRINKKPHPKQTKKFVSGGVWWEGVDSNHRSRRRQIYSLMHLATLQPARIKFLPRPLLGWTGNWSWRLESNPQPADYKSAALPVELRQHFAGKNSGALGWNRTADIRIFSPALYQLSYQGMNAAYAAKKFWRPETGSNRRPPA